MSMSSDPAAAGAAALFPTSDIADDASVHFTRLLGLLPEDALVLVFSYLPPRSHADLSSVCRAWYHLTAYPDVFQVHLARRVRYWCQWMQDQAKQEQTLAHLLACHPLLSSERANEHLELVALTRDTHPTATPRTSTSAHAGAPDATSTAPAPRRVTIQTSQLLNLVELLTSGCRSSATTAAIRRTSDSLPTNALTGGGDGDTALVAPLKTFALSMLDLHAFQFVDAPVCRALVHLPALTDLSLADCRLTDGAVRALIGHPHVRATLRRLDVSDNRQLTGKDWLVPPDALAAEQQEGGATPAASSSSFAHSSSSSSVARPFALTHLNLNYCTGLLPAVLGASFFSSAFLGGLIELDVSRTSSKLLFTLLKALHLLRRLERLDGSHSCGWRVSAGEVVLMRRGLYRSDPLATIEMALGDEEMRHQVGGEGRRTTMTTLAHLHTIDLSNNDQMQDEVLLYILEHCTSSESDTPPVGAAAAARAGIAVPALTDLNLTGCHSLTSMSLSEVLTRVGTTLRRLILEGVDVEETLDDLARLHGAGPVALAASAARSPATASLQLLPHLHTLSLCATDVSYPSLFAFLLASCPHLASLTLRSLRCRDRTALEEDDAQRRAREQFEAQHGVTLSSGGPPPSDGTEVDGVGTVYFARALTSKLPTLTEIHLTHWADLTDADLRAWTQEIQDRRRERRPEDEASSSSSAPPSSPPSSSASSPFVLRRLCLDECPRVTDSGALAALLLALTAGRRPDPANRLHVSTESTAIDTEQVASILAEHHQADTVQLETEAGAFQL